MDETQRHTELNTIYNEYKSFFPQARLVKDAIEYLKIQTVEGETIKITVDLGGWHQFRVLDDNGDGKVSPHFETFEALMQSISPTFRNQFGNELIRKLEILQKSQSDISD